MFENTVLRKTAVVNANEVDGIRDNYLMKNFGYSGYSLPHIVTAVKNIRILGNMQ